MTHKNALAQTLLAMAGQDNVITVHRPFVEFCDSLRAGMMLSQLLYWTPRAHLPDGWIAKTDEEFQEELCLSRYGVRKARTTLEDLDVVETKTAQFNGAPTTHYRLKIDELVRKWQAWLDSRLSDIEQSNVGDRTNDYSISNNRLSELEQSLTETTTESTAEITTDDTAAGDAGAVPTTLGARQSQRRGAQSCRLGAGANAPSEGRHRVSELLDGDRLNYEQVVKLFDAREAGDWPEGERWNPADIIARLMRHRYQPVRPDFEIETSEQYRAIAGLAAAFDSDWLALARTIVTEKVPDGSIHKYLYGIGHRRRERAGQKFETQAQRRARETVSGPWPERWPDDPEAVAGRLDAVQRDRASADKALPAWWLESAQIVYDYLPAGLQDYVDEQTKERQIA